MQEILDELKEKLSHIRDTTRLGFELYQDGQNMGEEGIELNEEILLQTIEKYQPLEAKLLLSSFIQGYKNGLTHWKRKVLQKNRELQKQREHELDLKFTID